MTRAWRLSASNFALVLAAILLMPFIAHAQQDDPCGSKNTQTDMNSCEAQRYATAQSEMNRVLQQLLTQYKTQRDFAAKLNAAQAAWAKFRDADADSFF